VFDCHEIDKLDAIKDNSIDVITVTNVLHHLKDPIGFLNRAASKLKHAGKVIATEPFFSLVSSPIFRYLHPEPVDFEISEPKLKNIRGPLASANIALPWLIFFRRRDWVDNLSANYDVAKCSVSSVLWREIVLWLPAGYHAICQSLKRLLPRGLSPRIFLGALCPRLCAVVFCTTLVHHRMAMSDVSALRGFEIAVCPIRISNLTSSASYPDLSLSAPERRLATGGFVPLALSLSLVLAQI
jgi:hypothetical protein